MAVIFFVTKANKEVKMVNPNIVHNFKHAPKEFTF
jgi:hypothetical protein